MRAPDRVTKLIRPIVEGLGFEFVGAEYHPARREGLLRIYIDSPNGIDVDDCARVSHQVSGALDVEDPIAGEYVLEVSSPGLDRPIFEWSDFARFTGEQARIRLHGLVDGRRKLQGRIVGAQGDAVVIDEQGHPVTVAFSDIDRAFVELEP